MTFQNRVMALSHEQKALEILRAMARTAADGAHTHIGDDIHDNEQRNLEAFVDGLHDVLVKGRGLSCKNMQTLENEVMAWRSRFPQYEYRPQDDCVALKLEHVRYGCHCDLDPGAQPDRPHHETEKE